MYILILCSDVIIFACNRRAIYALLRTALNNSLTLFIATNDVRARTAQSWVVYKMQLNTQLENNRWFSAVLLCIYLDNHTRVVPYYESCMAPPSKIWYNPCMIIRRYTAKQLKTIYYCHSYIILHQSLVF